MKRRIKKLHHDWHHRKPRSLGGINEDKNMSHVSHTQHQAWHLLFRNYSAQEIAKTINETWLDPEFVLIVERRLK